MSSGYSGTPLARKLGVKDGQKTWRWAMPDEVAEEIAQSGLLPKLLAQPTAGLEMVHLFFTERTEMVTHLARVVPLLAANGCLWISWPKKASGVSSDVSENIVRTEGLALGLVDIKVCAVNEIWSGLKFVIPKSARK